MSTIKIGGHLIGNKHPCFIIAEAGVNHNGHLEMAIELSRTQYKCCPWLRPNGTTSRISGKEKKSCHTL